ncbi:hypothetical protein Pcinc_038882 [Petrolisthes cinctipes]|uniref:Uncharacterized protein n=1 Tax=Petrolisthes cinctipes TaxID=88211 RepID=A0AAE1BQW9_PETCI|nr:hypothetical protein Pcinc_038882 [Petrolisthes cinctipes]
MMMLGKQVEYPRRKRKAKLGEIEESYFDPLFNPRRKLEGREEEEEEEGRGKGKGKGKVDDLFLYPFPSSSWREKEEVGEEGKEVHGFPHEWSKGDKKQDEKEVIQGDIEGGKGRRFSAEWRENETEEEVEKRRRRRRKETEEERRRETEVRELEERRKDTKQEEEEEEERRRKEIEEEEWRRKETQEEELEEEEWRRNKRGHTSTSHGRHKLRHGKRRRHRERNMQLLLLQSDFQDSRHQQQHPHSFQDSTFQNPALPYSFQNSRPQSLPHSFQDSTFQNPTLPHSFQDSTFQNPTLPHSFQDSKLKYSASSSSLQDSKLKYSSPSSSSFQDSSQLPGSPGSDTEGVGGGAGTVVDALQLKPQFRVPSRADDAPHTSHNTKQRQRNTRTHPCCW